MRTFSLPLVVACSCAGFLSGCGGPTLSPEGSKTIAAALVTYEFGKNELRATEVFKDTPYNIVGVFYSAEERDGGFKVVLLEDWSSSSVLYAHLPGSARESITSMDKGALVTLTCAGLEKYGTSPSFTYCDHLRKTDTGGIEPDLFLDDLVAKNNELLGNKPDL
jgi:hypothetical protein